MCTRLTPLSLAILLLIGAGAVRADLVSHWKLDDGAGTTALDSGPGGNNGTLAGKPTWITGVNKGALEFHGVPSSYHSGDEVNCGSKASLDIKGPISIALWIRPDADQPEAKGTAGGETAPMAKADSGANPSWSWQVRYGWGSTKPFMAFTFNTSPRAWAYVNKNLTRFEWCHIACSHDGTTLKCYLNGEQTDSTPMGAITSSPTPVLIGSDGWGCDWLGAIDDVRIYNHAISPGEVQAAMATEPIPTAYSPNPRNGEMVMATSVTLKWQPGDFAKLHEVYFGESFDAVSAATPASTDVFVGRQAIPTLAVGSQGGPAPTGLVPGTTYYWRVDEVNDLNPASPWKGSVWSFQVQPLTASKPYPPDGMKYVDPNQDLNWEKGMGTLFHTVYIGRSFDEVSNATTGGLMTANAPFEPGKLALDTTYYWRVDEFAYPANATFKGPVWSFTTRGTGGGAKAQYFKTMDLSGAPVLTRIESTINQNWAGEVVAGLSDNLSARWTANLEAPFTETYRIIATTDDGVKLWLDGRLVISDWVNRSASDSSASANLIAGQVYSIRMDWYENTGGAVAQLSWESPSTPRQIIPQGWLQLPVRAAGPYPANLATGAPQSLLLRWIAGDKAVSHDVYFGDNKDAVEGGVAPTARQGAGEVTYDPGTLEWGKTYYWRVDEVNAAEAGSPWKGVTWSFTTADFLVVDDFETYTDTVGERVFQTWLDGLGYTDPVEVAGNGTGSTVGNAEPPYAELTTVYSGYQAMPMDYNNAIDPYYSEAERTWASPQNWTVNGVNTLVLHVRGSPANGAGPLYVVLTDSSSNSAVVSHPDPAAVASNTWLEWKIPLSSFSKVNPAKIKKMCIGVGNRTAPAKGGAGHIVVDDIRVAKP